MSLFMPKPYTKQAISIALPEDILDKAEALAAEANLSRNAFINQCIHFALDHMNESSTTTA